MEMTELEKVLNALENCTAHPKCMDCGWKECEHEHETVEIPLTLAKDAISLLKAQEPRVMNAEELRKYLMVNENGLLSHDQWQELGQRAPLYIEFRRPDEYQVNWRTAERLRPWAMESMFWDSYDKDRRCWTARPTDEQREAVKWDE